MANEIEAFFSSVSLFSEADLLFSVCLTVLCTGLLVDVILSACVYGFDTPKRLWYVFLCVGTALTHIGFCGLEDNNYVKLFCLLAVSVLGCIPLSLIRVRERKETEDEEDLVRFIDKKIKDADEDDDDGFSVERLRVRPQRVETPPKSGIDFSHVKNILERINFYELAPSDKKQVKDLESYIYRAESGEENADLKERINDGLGALLKIMSKYGV